MHDNMVQLQKIKVPFSKKELTNSFERLLILKKYKKYNNTFIAISFDAQKYALNNLPNCFKKNMFFIPNAIDFKHFENKSVKSVKSQANINLVTIGSLVEKKNQAFLVPVVSILKGWGYNTKLQIVGEGPNRNKIIQEIHDFEMEKSIFLPGNSDVEEFYWNADLYVHSATYEPFGLVLLEAMAAGLPVVCLDGKGNRDLIEQGKNGYMVLEQNPELFAQKVYEIWKEKALYKSMSEYAVEFAKQYDIVPYVDRLLEVYRGE